MSRSVLIFCLAAVLFASSAQASSEDDTNHRLGDPIPHVADIHPRFVHRYVTPQKKSSPKRHWIVLFYTRWCQSCNEWLEPLKASAATLSSDTLKFGKVDVTDETGPAVKYGVDDFPTLIAVHSDSIETATPYAGERTEVALKAWIASVLQL